MAYLKLFQVVSDFALGFQTLNQGRDNNEAMKDLYDANHSLGADGYGTMAGMFSGLQAPGRHDDRLIARSVFRYVVDTTLPVPLARPIVSGPINVAPPLRLGVGQWRISLSRQQLAGAIAIVESSAIVDRKATVLVSNGSTTGGTVTVSTWNVATPALADYDFDLVLWLYNAI